MSFQEPTRRNLLQTGLALTGVMLAGCTGGSKSDDSGSSGSSSISSTAWRTAALTDVRTGEEFAIADFGDRPVLVETFAVWCSTCLAQQKQIRSLHERVGDDVVSVSLNVDPNEDVSRVRNHLDRHGFEWRYAISPPAVTESLVDAYGQSITVPPQAPMVLVCAGGDTRRLPNGVKSADDLQNEIEAGC